MSQYNYRARNRDGQEVKGTLQAPNEERASALLQANGLIPIAVSAAGAASILHRTVLAGGVASKDLILFSRQLASMIRAGVPIVQALRALLKQINKPALMELLEQLAYDIKGGSSFSQALARHPHTFSVFYVGVVRTGEASGRLSDSLLILAAYLEQAYSFNRRVRAAMLYPVFVVAVVIIIVILMFAFVVPQLAALFAESQVPLPWPTRLLIAVTGFFAGYWYLIGLVAAALAFLTRWYLKTPEGQYALGSWLLRIPLVRTLFQKIYLARLTSILHTLFNSNVPVIESLKIARDSMNSAVYQRVLDETASAVKDGAALSTVWQYEPFIPPMLTAMVAVGERSGEVQKAFDEANAFYRRDVEEILDSITVFLEPVMVILLGIGVAIVVSAVILPIYNLVLVL